MARSLLSSVSLPKLERKGKCLLKLKIEQKFTGLYGRTIIVLVSGVFGKPINTQNFSSGDIVSISENSVPPSQLETSKDLITGTVTKVAQQSVSIAIENDIETLDQDLNDNSLYKIIKLSNNITHKRIKNALVSLKEASMNERSSKLADVLFLNREPEQAQNAAGFDEMKFFNKRLDESQKDAVKFTFQQKELAIIHGPPGTGYNYIRLFQQVIYFSFLIKPLLFFLGKTTTLVEIIKQNCLKYKQKVLCCAPSNIAVDNLVERLSGSEEGFGRIKMIRLGHPARLLESIQEYSLDSVLSRSDQYNLANDIKGYLIRLFDSIRLFR